MKHIKESKLVHFLQVLSPKIYTTAENRKLFTRFFFVCLFIIALIMLSSFLVWRIEYQGNQDNTIRTFWDSIWWAIVTVATVGYGDKVPLTPSGRFVGLILIAAGFTLLSVFSGLIASLFVEDRIKGAKGLKQVRAHNHIVICGWNKTGFALLKSLVDKELTATNICVVTNQSQEFFDNVLSQFRVLQISFVKGEPTQEDVLKRASISKASQVIILADQEQSYQNADDRSIIVANTVHFLAGKAKITVQLLNGDNKNMLQRIGISDVMVYDDIGGSLLANNILDKSSLSIFGNLLKAKNHAFLTYEIDEDYIDKPFGELFDHLYKQGKLLIGLISSEPDLDIESIFDDNASAIDQFIKSTLNESKKMHQEEKNNIRWNPPRDSMIQENDYAIILL